MMEAMDFTVSKELTVNKIKTVVKAAVNEAIINALNELVGEENVMMVRTGSGDSKTNEIGFIVGSGTNDGDTNPICITLNPTVKEFVARATAKKTYEPFDIYAANQVYNDYLADKATKESEAAEKKAKKIAADKAARAKKETFES